MWTNFLCPPKSTSAQIARGVSVNVVFSNNSTNFPAGSSSFDVTIQQQQQQQQSENSPVKQSQKKKIKKKKK